MKVFAYTLLIVFAIAACRQSQSPAVTNVIDSAAQKNKITTDTKGANTLANMDTTQMVVDSAVNITVNNTALNRKENAVYQALYSNWLRAYSESAHLPAALHIQYIGTVMMGARGDIMDEVVKAQDKMKQYIAMDKYKKLYESLAPAQQAEMQQQHTILFQKEFR